MNSLLKQLKQAMIHQGITQTILAQRTGLTETTISRYMNGTREPNLTNLQKMAHVVGFRAVLIDEKGIRDE